MRGVRITVHDTVEDVEIDGLESMQAVVDGYIESVPLPRASMYVNEEGLLKRLPYNPIASYIGARDLVGDALVLGPVSDDGEETPIPDFWHVFLHGLAWGKSHD